MVSARDVSRAAALVCIMMGIVFAQPGARKLRADPLSALDNTNLDELLEMELDDVFLVPKTMLEEVGASAESGEEGVRHGGSSRRHQPRNLQEGEVANTPSPSLASPTGAPTGANDRGISSSYFSSYYESPSAAPTAAPTMGSDSRGGVFGSASPTATPSSAPADLDADGEDVDGDRGIDVEVPRDVAAASERFGGGSAGPFAVVATAVTISMVLAATVGVLP